MTASNFEIHLAKFEKKNWIKVNKVIRNFLKLLLQGAADFITEIT